MRFLIHLIVMAIQLMAIKILQLPLTIIFTNIGSKLASKILSSDRDFNTNLSRAFNSSFSLFYIDQTELLSICSNLKVKNSTGHDNISRNVLVK